MWRGRAEEGWNSPSWAGRMCGKQIPPSRSLPPAPPDCLLPLLVPSNSFLSLLCPFCNKASGVILSGLCLWVGDGMEGHSQLWLTPIPYTSPEYLARMEAVVNLYHAMIKHIGKMPSTCPSSCPEIPGSRTVS